MKITLHIPLTPKGRQVVSAGVMLVLGLAVIVGTKDYVPRTFEASSHTATPADAKKNTPPDAEYSGAEEPGPETDGSGKPASPAQAEQEHAGSSVRLNMAYVYPEGMETGDVWDSYAGQACELLSELDSDWVAGMYETMKLTPEKLSGQLGISRNAVLGLYDPAVETQIQDDPDSWVVPDWTKNQVVFRDGDGNLIGGYSNAKDIISMASVYAYRQGDLDGEGFLEYCRQLWEASHQDTVQIGEVYYCDGTCRLEREATEETDDGAAEGSLEDGNSKTTAVESAAETSPPVTVEAYSNQTVPETFPTEGVSEPSPESSADPAETSAEHLETTAEQAGGNAETSAETSGASEASETMDADEIRSRYTMADVPADWESYEGPAREVWEAVIAAYGGQLPADETSAASEEEAVCPGHLDLEITAVIQGIDGTGRLFDADTIGNAPGAVASTEPGAVWQGWTKMNRHHARCIWNQNWETAYGLPVITTLYMGNPLSAAEISYYMDMLPEEVTVFQREVIRQALQSVGCIPYYWGGKAAAAGYDGNGFGTVTAEDVDGRRLRGLDCSGWINWVYWTALGTRLEYESTSGLTQLGTAIGREQLQAGDIIVRTNTENSHVYLFLAWAPDGEMYVIHETSGDINNVTVSKLNADGPHYRRLLHQ